MVRKEDDTEQSTKYDKKNRNQLSEDKRDFFM